ncbi:glycosyltransferase family 2 protein [Polynucleobacter asymbioticus]|uniref:glycosyltransferase family 2 protein n=1 Tax=Polynucleobacter asymbioticus TaxID=576611 RepID=UPI0008F8F717|nr:glycosyltransferase family 2 protein [Polynucleobacter asymbioticus]
MEKDKKIPLVSIITVVYNNENYIEKTILSVINQDYNNFEYIVVDGNSTDKTLKILNLYSNSIDSMISENDNGIYDAMNKGIALAKGEWLCFMNSGDEFSSNEIITKIFKKNNYHNKSFIYSDVYLKNNLNKIEYGLHKCSHISRSLVHQSAIYRKKLHLNHGNYLVSKNVTISDYLFFCLVPDEDFIKTEVVIARYDISGKSSTQWSREQKILIDWLLGRIGKFEFLLRIIFYPLRYIYLYSIRSIKILLKRKFYK